MADSLATEVVDELFAVRNLLYMGSYQQVINEATNPASPPRSEDARLELRCLLYRAYVAQGKHNLVLSEIDEHAAPPDLRAVRILAAYLQAAAAGNPAARDAAVSAARALLAENAPSPRIQLLVASVLYHEDLLEDVLKVLAPSRRNLECVALFVQTLLKMDRTDLARTEVTNLKTWSEDAPIAQLIEAWVGLKTGGDSYQQAFYIYEELGQSSAAQTAKMLNGKAVANFCLGKNSEAESGLLEALNKDPNDPETLVNLIACSIHLAKPADVIKRYTNQLKDVAPKHPFLQDLELKESLFDRSAARFALST